MPGFELEQVDGGSPIELPYGETVLGRGLFLGVNDKRVSRNHGILENQNGQLRLKPTHLNPCFIQTNIVASPQPLEKDQWHCLKEGDIFSLMPGKYIYRVRVKDDDQTHRNNQAFEEEVEKCSSGPGAPSKDSATLEANSCTPTSPSATLTEDKGAGDPSHTLSSPNEDDAPTLKSSRVGSVPDEENSTGVMECDDGERRRGGRGAEVRQGAHAEDSKTREEDASDSQVSQGRPQSSKITESKTSTNKVKKQRRTPCPYGSSCYRKNPVHFQECSHPGDSDYEEEEAEDADDDRPECPYGTHCYRKNLLHKKEYKHTKSPPKTAAADEDDDHYEDSFINDEREEEEVDEDSDYMPESDDSGKEDIKHRQKEAKAFVRRKK